MVAVGRRNLFAEKTRLFISVGGVAFSVLLILIVFGLYRGFGSMSEAYINHVDADLWVLQRGAGDMFHGVSLIPADMEAKLAGLPEVKSVERLLGRQVVFQVGGRETHTYVLGYDTAGGGAGPISIKEGAPAPGLGQIIVDKVFARNEGIKLGDLLNIQGSDFTVAGVSEKGNMMMYQFSFMNREDAQKLLKMDGWANFFLVKLKDPNAKDAATRSINEIGSVEALDRAQFAAGNGKSVNDAFLPIILVLLVISFGVGVTIIGLTIYTATVEKAREYGVLKAIGAGNRQLYRIIFEQAVISGVLGFALGAVMTFGVVYLATDRVPSFVVSVEPWSVAAVFGVSLLMSLAASYIPVRRIVAIDPAAVFKS